MQLDLVRLDQRVREQLLAHPLHLRPGVGGVRRLELQIDDLADARLRDGEAEVPQRAADGLALRVEDALLRADENRRLHASTTLGSSTYRPNGIVVSRSNAST